MPTSLSVPVVEPAPRCARNPRSGPLQRSSASPIAATGATAGTATPTTAPTSGSRSPRWLTACGPHASTRSASWRPRWAKPRSVAAGRAVLEVELDLLDLEPGADGVDRHPRLDAEARARRGNTAARARGESARWPGERLARRRGRTAA